ncbi:hypothetical protein FSP39_010913 [Pinctada imbricata]|uniref:THAP-type domain-containing protein n=1 Tax=Pinctada imbricata TaxID=66713 RepID=A0AA89C572_PINIB|nr:hypothetical protein FSP39_010913 [Pinctada imbricata]
MGGGDRCAVGGCNNDRRYPERYIIRSHVSNLQFHSLPKDLRLREIWHKKISQGRKNYKPSDYVKICSNHFEDGERTARCQIPTLFLTPGDFSTQHSPHKRKNRSTSGVTPKQAAKATPDQETDTDRNNNACIFDSLLSSIFITWVRLMRLELSSLIVWPSREVVRQNLPDCFQHFYPKLRCIIDCTEVFIETPSSLDTQAKCWSDYKHNCTVTFLVAITPNGSISYVSPCYGGRASDKFITNDCNFLNLLEPYDQVMADRGFKIKEDLMTVQATLAIPPSTVGSLQMCSSAVKDTSKIANVRIYVEQAIGRLKNYRFLKNEIPITCLPVVDDIVIVSCALCNLLDPLC